MSMTAPDPVCLLALSLTAVAVLEADRPQWAGLGEIPTWLAIGMLTTAMIGSALLGVGNPEMFFAMFGVV